MTRLKAAKNDTLEANILYKFSRAHWGSDPEKALNYAEQCLSVSKKTSYQIGIANAYTCYGAVFHHKGDHMESLKYHKMSLKLCEEIGYKKLKIFICNPALKFYLCHPIMPGWRNW